MSELALVLGFSMGAQQTYEWAIRYPDVVKRAAHPASIQMRDYDAGRNANRDLASTLAKIKAKNLVIAIEEDGCFARAAIVHEQSLILNSALKIVSSAWGHLAPFGADPAYYESIDAI